MDWLLGPEQFEFVTDLTSPAIALRGGVGSGKSYAAVRAILMRSKANPPEVQCAIVEPTYPMVRDIIVPLFRDCLDAAGVWYRLNKSTMELEWDNPSNPRVILLRSGDVPDRLAGLNLGCALMDEAALQDKLVDGRLSQRLRDPRARVRQMLYTSTPEGLNWFHKLTQGIKTLTVPTTSNKHLPPDFIERLKRKYTPGTPQYRMYVLGEAVELTGGIYTNYDSRRNAVVCDNPRAGSVVLGWDFNVGYMVTPVGAWHRGVLHICGEVVSKGSVTTDSHAERVTEYLVKRRLGRVRPDGVVIGPDGARIEAYSDASGNARTTNATKSDHYHVEEAGYTVRAPKANPLVRDRIAAVQYALSEGRLLLDPVSAPLTTQAIREHAYAKNTQPPEPQKRWGEDDEQLDHYCDAVGYTVWGLMPTRSTASIPRSGMRPAAANPYALQAMR